MFTVAAHYPTDEKMTRRELTVFALGALVLIGAEAALNHPGILFGRYLWFDELQIKLITSQPGVWHSMVALAHAGDETPPTYYLLARAAWWIAALFGASAETAFRALALAGMWMALVLTYAVLRRSFAMLPAMIAVLLLWACPLTARYAFFARPYSLLVASTAAFCLAYGVERVGRSSAVAIAVSAMFVCGIHYFGLITLAAILMGDWATRQDPWRAKLKRLFPAAAGLLTWMLLLPIFLAQIAGYEQRTFLSPLTWRFARTVIVAMFYVPVIIIMVLLSGWGIFSLRGAKWKSLPSFATMTRAGLQPVMGMLALLSVPLAILMISMRENHFLDRYMITALLGLTPAVTLIASRLPRGLQIAVALSLMVIGASTMRDLGAHWTRWQADQSDLLEECTAMATDGYPLVALTSLEAYSLYEYAPSLRDKLYFVDLRPTHRHDLTPGTLNDGTCFRKWHSVVPNPPRIVTLDDLTEIGKFHVVFRTEFPVMKNGFLPFRKVAGFGASGVFQVDPGYRKMIKRKAEAQSDAPATVPRPAQHAEAYPRS